MSPSVRTYFVSQVLESGHASRAGLLIFAVLQLKLFIFFAHPDVAGAISTPACVLAGLLPGLEAYGDSDESSDNSDRDSSSGVEDAAVILSSIAILRGKRSHEPDIGE